MKRRNSDVNGLILILEMRNGNVGAQTIFIEIWLQKVKNKLFNN
jgi:hypothetical protein